MPRPKPLPDDLAAAPFSVAAARAAGLTRARLRSSDLSAPFFGIRVAGAVGGIRWLARAYAARMSPDQFFSHSTAAPLLGMRMPEGWREPELHVSSVAPAQAPRAAGVIGHQSTRPVRVIVVEGVRVSSPLDAWCQLGASRALDDLVALGDGILGRQRPLSTPLQLAAAAAFIGRGGPLLTRAAGLVRPGTDPPRETQLRLLVVRAGFPEPEVNGVIHNVFGAVIAHGDLVFRDFRTVLDYDGGQHRADDHQFIDIDRLDAIMAENWRVIRVNKNLMRRRATLIGKIDAALRSGGWTPTVAPRPRGLPLDPTSSDPAN